MLWSIVNKAIFGRKYFILAEMSLQKVLGVATSVLKFVFCLKNLKLLWFWSSLTLNYLREGKYLCSPKRSPLVGWNLVEKNH